MSDVAIIMGSDSDWPTMEDAAKILDELGISYTADVVSAHRMPLEMVEFSQTAQSKGYKVIIAGAGGAAHLPGMVASLTTPFRAQHQLWRGFPCRHCHPGLHAGRCPWRACGGCGHVPA